MVAELHRLRRYTSLSPAIQILRKKAITLLTPKLWEDQNDRYGLEQFASKRGHQAVLALCFTEQFETFHHWKVFTPGLDGICLEFDKEELLAHAERAGLLHGQVVYRDINALKRDCPPLTEELPFLKRSPYRDEQEYRLIHCSTDPNAAFLDVPIDLSCIRAISLSPWMPAAFRDPLVATLRDIDGCQSLKISRSTLLANDRWKTALANAIEPKPRRKRVRPARREP